MIALVTAGIVTIFNKRSRSIDRGFRPGRSLEKQVRAKNADISLEGEDAQKLQELIHAGNKIGAIKLIREKKGLDLLDAKNIVDAMSRPAQS